MLRAFTTLAHAGHDHTYAAAGEWHHWLWVGGAAFALASCVCGAARYRRSR